MTSAVVEVLGQVEDVPVAQGARRESDAAGLSTVPHPRPDEVIAVAGLPGKAIQLAFDPEMADFIRVKEDVVAALPNGGKVVLEEFMAALSFATKPSLWFEGTPLTFEEFLDAHGGKLQIAPAGEGQEPPPSTAGGGRSAYSDDFVRGNGEVSPAAAGSKFKWSLLEAAEESTSGEQDQSVLLAEEPVAPASFFVPPGRPNAPSAAREQNGFGKGGKKGPKEEDGDGVGGGAANQAPADLDFDNDSVPENGSGGLVVGVVRTLDPDPGDRFTYELVDDAGGRFVIDTGTGTLTVADGAVIDYEAAAGHDVTIRVADRGGAIHQETFTIHVTDVNEPPTDLDLSGTKVPAGAPTGSLIGVVSVSDPDEGDRFTFELVDDAVGRFAIDGTTGALTVANGATLDYEAAASHDITIRVTDSGGESYDETFTLALETPADDGGDNAAPTAIALDNQSVEEAAAGAIVGRLAVSDPDAGDSHGFGVDDARFEVVDGQLKLKDGVSLDFETESELTITVTATDSGGLSTSQAFAITVLDVNEPPTDILLGTDVDENVADGTLVKIAVAVDPDQGDSFTFELLDDAGGRFAIDGTTGALTVANGAALDYEAAASHDITIRVTDSGAETYQETFTIHVNDVNEAPTDLDLSATSVLEKAAAGSLVGTVIVSDPDAGDAFTFELLDDAGGRFAIDRASGQIRVADGSHLDFEAGASYGVTVRATDRGGLVIDESFTLTVDDVAAGANSPPTSITLDNLSIEEIAAGAAVGRLAVDDPDAGDSHVFAVHDARFEVVDSTLKLKDGVSLDHEAEGAVTLAITATDSGGLSRSESFTLAVEDVNDAPVARDDVVSVHFESTGEGSVEKLWEDDFSGAWTKRWPMYWVGRDDWINTFERGGETWLRVTHIKGEIAKGFKSETEHAPRDRMYLQYKIRFPEDVDWVKGGKLPSLYGGVTTAGVPPTGEDGWKARLWWGAGGKGGVVAHYPDETSRWGESLENIGAFQFQRGVIHTLGLEVVMNTPGQRDGVIRTWLDGVLVVERTDIRFRDIPELQIDGIGLSTFYGGSTDDWAPTKDETFEFGDFKLYEAPPWEGGELVAADPVTIDLLDDDSDPDGDDLNVTNIDQPNSGTVTDNGDGTVTYQPDESFHLYDSFSYTVSDVAGGESTARVRIWDDSLNPVLGTAAGETLNGTSAGDYISGGDGDDSLFGKGGNDVLFGGAGDDILDGGEGNDVLIGGLGADIIDVGLGTNLVIYESVLDAGDTINRFNAAEGHDIISLDPMLDSLGVATADRASRIAVEKDGNVHALRIDTTGDGLFDLMVATVNVINGNTLDIRQDNGDVNYGTLG